MSTVDKKTDPVQSDKNQPMQKTEVDKTKERESKKKKPVDYEDFIKNHDPSTNTSPAFLTKYEKTSVINLRMQQLVNGAPSLLNKSEFNTIRELAHAELEQNKLPFNIVRQMPNGKNEYWRLEDLRK